MRGGFDVPAAHAHLSGPEVFAWWQEARAGLLAALRPLDPKDRIPWFGPPMSARSFATARLMETWSHGWDVAEALGRPDPPTDRLRHVAHLGVVTRGWSYAVRGRPVPEEPVRVELEAPSGAEWTWGPDGVPDVVRGPRAGLLPRGHAAAAGRRHGARGHRAAGAGVDGHRAGLRRRGHHDRSGSLTSLTAAGPRCQRPMAGRPVHDGRARFRSAVRPALGDRLN